MRKKLIRLLSSREFEDLRESLDRQAIEIAELQEKFTSLLNAFSSFSANIENLRANAEQAWPVPGLPPANFQELERGGSSSMAASGLHALANDPENVKTLPKEAEFREELAFGQLAKQERENTALADAVKSLENKNQELEKKLDKNARALANAELANKALQSANKGQVRTIGELRESLAEKDRRFASLREKLPELENLAALKASLESLAEREKEILGAYYDISSISAFLAGAGQFGRLEQLFDSCARKIRAGQKLENLANIVAAILRFYNQANPDSQAALFEARAGEVYNYTREDRVAQNGRLVEKTLFPGLLQPNGALCRKCLVDLK